MRVAVIISVSNEIVVPHDSNFSRVFKTGM